MKYNIYYAVSTGKEYKHCRWPEKTASLIEKVTFFWVKRFSVQGSRLKNSKRQI